MSSASDLRLRLLTLKHYLHQNLLEFLARPDAGRYLKIGGGIAATLLLIISWQVTVWLISVISYHRNPIPYLHEYYNPLTPRFVDTSSYRTPEHKVMDLDAYKEELFKINQFNTYLSDKLPINRRHGDPRTEGCRMAARSLTKDEDLVSASIIMVMYNEELSILLRSIVSILLNTPMESLKEILIIDDKSSRYELGARLDQELRQFPFVRLIRNSKREGLIRSRIIGAKAALGKVLIFLDSHIEVLEGWYSPLISRVMSDKRTVVCPIVAAIDHTTLEVVTSEYTNTWGTWDWDMKFFWEAVPPRENQRRTFDDSVPIRTPAMSGGLFAMNKDFFFEIGAYDPGMKVWGGENLELSFRIWMCGGALEINTCSYVGHVFRKPGVKQKSIAEETALLQNLKRVVEVWLDDYKDTCYKAAPAMKNVIEGDVVSRTLLRQRLKCKSFSWYLREVDPDKPRPDRDFVAYGEIKGPGDQCMDSMGSFAGTRAGVYNCHGKGYTQFWKLHLSGEIKNAEFCLDGDGTNPRNVVLYACHGLGGNQQWFLTEDGYIKHGGSGMCLSHDSRFLMLMPCSNEDRFVWQFSGISEAIREKFYVLYSKQFNYTTKKQVEENMKKAEEERKARKAAAEEKRREEERKKEEEDTARKAEEERLKAEEAKLKAEEAKLKAAEVKLKAEEERRKREQDEEEVEKKKLLEKELEELREWKKLKAEKEKVAAEKEKQELERMKKEKEMEEKRKLDEIDALKKEKEAEERRKSEELAKQKELEKMRKEKELEEMKKAKELEEIKKAKKLEMRQKKEELSKEDNAEIELADKTKQEQLPEGDKDRDVEEKTLKDHEKDLKPVEDKNTDTKEKDLKSDKLSKIEDAELKEFLAWKSRQKKES